MTWLPWQPDQYHLLTVHQKDLSITIKMILTPLKSDHALPFCAYFSETTFFRQKCPGICRVPPPERLAHLGLNPMHVLLFDFDGIVEPKDSLLKFLQPKNHDLRHKNLVNLKLTNNTK